MKAIQVLSNGLTGLPEVAIRGSSRGMSISVGLDTRLEVAGDSFYDATLKSLTCVQDQAP